MLHGAQHAQLASNMQTGGFGIGTAGNVVQCVRLYVGDELVGLAKQGDTHLSMPTYRCLGR